jgi:hypothetical protein
MTLQIDRHGRQALASLVLAFTALAGCNDNGVAPHRVPPPPDHLTNLGTVIVEVNTETGEVTTHPYASAAADLPPGVDAAIYAAQSLIGHTFQLVGGTHTKTWTLSDRIENLQPFAIGTRIPHTLATLPADTMGVYVFISIAPTVTQGCAPSVGCAVKADSGYDGNFAFTAPAQPYIYFKTILEPNDGVLHSGQDFSGTAGGVDYFRTFSFRTTSTGVRNFKFGVTVSAAFVQPHDTRWAVSYFGDSLPNRVGTGLADLRSEPDWRVRGSIVADTSIATTGCAGTGVTNCLQIRTSAPTTAGTTDSLIYFRSDSLGTADSAFMEATLSDSGLVANQPSVTFGMQDGVKAIAFGIARASAGFVKSGNTFVTSGSGAVTTATTTTWRIRKFAHDSVVAYANGVKIVNVPYASLPAAPAAVAKPQYFWFGNRFSRPSPPSSTPLTSKWSSVTYTIGATAP